MLEETSDRNSNPAEGTANNKAVPEDSRKPEQIQADGQIIAGEALVKALQPPDMTGLT